MYTCIDRHLMLRVLNLSYTVTIPATIHHDSSRFEADDKIGVHRDGNKDSPASIRYVSRGASTVSARFIYGSTMIYDDNTTFHHGGTTNAHDVSTILYGTSMVQLGSSVYVIVLLLFLKVPWVVLQCVIEVFPDPTHLLFHIFSLEYQRIVSY